MGLSWSAGAVLPVSRVVTRFAPSPTGPLHLGHVHAAVFAWQRAKEAGGCFLLRLEDIDRARCSEAAAVGIQDDLVWLGLGWDGDVLVQSQGDAGHRAALGTLGDEGLIYPCFCTRADILREIACVVAAPHGPDNSALYPGTCRRLRVAEREARIAAGAPHAWRLDMAAAEARTGPLTFREKGRGLIACEPAGFGDVVLGRRDGAVSYHLCVVHDDAVQGVTLVTRGEDLLEATGVHRVLQTLLGLPEPDYAHHRLLNGPDGKRLSKRDKAAGVASLRAAGASPGEVLRLAGCPNL